MKRHFTEDEVEDWFYEGNITEGEDRRWSSTDTSIVEIDGKHYKLYAEIGSTECQENYYEAQDADEVELKTYEKTITVNEWIVKEE